MADSKQLAIQRTRPRTDYCFRVQFFVHYFDFEHQFYEF